MSLIRLHRKTTSASASWTRKLSAGTLTETVSDEKGAYGLNLLHDPPNPVASLVFVHGLGGGSRKTWSKTASSLHYWPQEWLPVDDQLSQVRILSFGYDSDWAKGKNNVLNIHHFGKALLADLNTSPSLQHEHVPIILIGHSMGGCVIKKAYILASQDNTQSMLVKRIHSIVFLATPHRGSELAKVLSNVLEVKSSSRAYVDDLQTCSEALQTINDEFRNYSSNLGLWSFYETQKLHLGMFSTLVVAVDSAVLGYREERQIPMTADHRSICKFDSPEDPNYRIIRNSLATIVKEITSKASNQNEETVRSQIKTLRSYLGVDGPPEDDLVTVDDARLSGTCSWFSERTGFKEWRDRAPGSPAVLWINGKPAAGKTVLAGWLVNQLQASREKCSFYFFKHGDKFKLQLSACLRSLAFQMACFHTSIRSALLQMHNDDVSFDKENECVIWRKVFTSVILRQQFSRHFWVIDALDECVNTAFFESILRDTSESGQLRVSITSRENPELGRLFASLGPHKVRSEPITTDDTLTDMKLLIEAKGKALGFINDEDRSAITNRVVEKSSGSFLWTVLVMNELSRAHSEKEVKRILDEVPREMEPLYTRALDSMAHFARSKELIKCILTWVTCALRPLSIGELKGALELEIKDTFPKLAESIHTLCCQLVIVDRFGKVQMVHETARQFLLGENLQSEFAIRKHEAHSNIVRTCFRYLNNDHLKPPRSGRRSSASASLNKKSDFPIYACFAFADHLVRADPQADDILDMTTNFLISNVLSWIEWVAEAQELDLLIRTSNRFRAYAKAVSTHISPLCSQIGTIKGWAVDLVRITAKFGDALVTCPWAIHSLIIPFCPSASKISKATHSGRGLSVVGLSSTQWDDRISSISFQNQATTISQGDKFFAVGLSDGKLVLHHAGSCQEYRSLDHGEAVRFIGFKSSTNLMASCSLKTVKVWDIRTGAMLYSFKAPPGPIGLLFDGDELMVASHKKVFAVCNLASPMSQTPDRAWHDSFEEQSGSSPVPCALSFSIGHRMLAVGYVRGPITLWDIEANELYGRCCATTENSTMSSHRVTALVLNPNPSIELLAVSYLDGMLVLLDPFQDRVLETFRANCLNLASSVDGQLLAAGAGNGLIQIYAFETLRMLYQVQTSNIHIKQLVFDSDSLRLMDIRRAQCNIWEPPILLREAINDDNSVISSGSVVEGTASGTSVKTTALCVHPKGRRIFCGKDDGSVSMHDIKTGHHQETLYKQKSRIRILTCSPGILLSVDISNAVSIWDMQSFDGSKSQEQRGPKLVFQQHMDCEGSICQAIIGEDFRRFIISTRNADYLHEMTGAQENKMVRSEQEEDRHWVQDPQNSTQLLCVDRSAINVYSWDNWTKLRNIPITGRLAGLQLKSARTCYSNRTCGVLFELTEFDSPSRAGRLRLYDIAALGSHCSLAATDAAKDVHEDSSQRNTNLLHGELLRSLEAVLQHVLSVSHGKRLVFLDSQSWVCSVDLSIVGAVPNKYLRHFFVPRDWFSGMSNILCDLWQNDIIFAHNNDTIVVKGAFNFSQEVSLPLG